MPRLDVETDEQRRERLGNLFSTISSSGGGGDGEGEAPFLIPPSRPFAMPESDALARVRAFLPLMAQANADLAARAATEGADSVVIDGQIARDAGEEKTNPEVATARGDADCESAGEGKEDKEEIEMDVGVGVFDVQGDIGGADVGPVVERDAAVWEGKVAEVKGQGKGEVEAKGAEA